ncbi:MAG: hypothetical protein J5858_10480 [Lentisphaeria bacterium]|nr:hypothetical protein [Lentisphaeria bacterium]
MKDKYFGDKHDFRKYVLLSFLQECTGYTIAINWMRTKFEANPDNSDGNKRNYESWSSNDERIYKILQQPKVQNDSRSVEDFQTLNILPDNTLLWSTYVPDRDNAASKNKLKELRKKWYADFLSFSQKANMIFFDPDNGIEVKSAPKGTKESYKYLYCDEINDVFLRGQDILIYQHKPRMTLENMMQGKRSMLVPITKRSPLIFVAGEVVYFFLTHNIETSMDVVKEFKNKDFSPDFLSIIEP